MTRDELIEALPEILRLDYRAVVIDGKTPRKQAEDRDVAESTVHNNVNRAEEKLEQWDLEVGHLPDHLFIDDGRIRCRVCERPISIGSNRVEYGHARWSRGHDVDVNRCPHRPDSVDPSTPGETSIETGDVVQGPDGLFRASSGGESA